MITRIAPTYHGNDTLSGQVLDLHILLHFVRLTTRATRGRAEWQNGRVVNLARADTEVCPYNT
jgi:hypothetical protein